MYRSWQDCYRRGENRSWPSVSVESVHREYWCLTNAIVYAFIMRLTVEERVLRSTFKLNICIIMWPKYIHVSFNFVPAEYFYMHFYSPILRHPVVTSKINCYLQNSNSTFFLIYAYVHRQHPTFYCSSISLPHSQINDEHRYAILY